MHLNLVAIGDFKESFHRVRIRKKIMAWITVIERVFDGIVKTIIFGATAFGHSSLIYVNIIILFKSKY